MSVLHESKEVGIDHPRHTDKTGPAFDIQIVRRGIPPEVLKRRNLMTIENPVYVNEVVVTFKGDDQNNVSWSVRTDESVSNSMHASFEELARSGAPLSVMGIRALYEILCENMVVLALEKGNLFQCRQYLQESAATLPEGSDDVLDMVDGDIGEGVVIH